MTVILAPGIVKTMLRTSWGGFLVSFLVAVSSTLQDHVGESPGKFLFFRVNFTYFFPFLEAYELMKGNNKTQYLQFPKMFHIHPIADVA